MEVPESHEKMCGFGFDVQKTHSDAQDEQTLGWPTESHTKHFVTMDWMIFLSSHLWKSI